MVGFFTNPIFERKIADIPKLYTQIFQRDKYFESKSMLETLNQHLMLSYTNFRADLLSHNNTIQF